MTTPSVPAMKPSASERAILFAAIDGAINGLSRDMVDQIANMVERAGFHRGADPEGRPSASGWIACSDRLPRLTADTGMGRSRSAAVLCLFPDDGNTHPGLDVRPAYYLQYDDWGEWYEPCDGGGGLDRCTSHGSPAPTHWMPLPTPPAPDNTDKAREEAGEGKP